MQIHRHTVILAALGVVDLGTTLWLVQRCDAAEANPLMARILAHGPFLFALTKIGLLAAALGVLEWAWRRRPRFVGSAARFAVAGYICLYALGVARANLAPYMGGDPGTSPLQQRLWAQNLATVRDPEWRRRHPDPPRSPQYASCPRADRVVAD